jgi:hypothetical protein
MTAVLVYAIDTTLGFTASIRSGWFKILTFRQAIASIQQLERIFNIDERTG